MNTHNLQEGQTIDFKSATSTRTSIGKILEFRTAPESPDSLWMNVKDAETDETEWISVNVWAEQKQNGVFPNREQQQPTTKNEPASSQSSNFADDPF